jgi:hypothetical protein
MCLDHSKVKKQNKMYNTLVLPTLLHGIENLTIAARDLNGLQNKRRDCNRTKYKSSFGQNTGLRKKLDTTCQQNVSSQITESNKKNYTPKGRRNQWRPLKRLLVV